jgi:hypothetical protein
LDLDYIKKNRKLHWRFTETVISFLRNKNSVTLLKKYNKFLIIPLLGTTAT